MNENSFEETDLIVDENEIPKTQKDIDNFPRTTDVYYFKMLKELGSKEKACEATDTYEGLPLGTTKAHIDKITTHPEEKSEDHPQNIFDPSKYWWNNI